jgi:hypothetical protein
MFIHRPDRSATEKEIEEGAVKRNVAEIIIEKHRNGPTGIVELYFKGESTKFVNLNYETGEPETDEQEFKAKAPVKMDEPELPDFSQAIPEPEQFEQPNTVDDEIF